MSVWNDRVAVVTGAASGIGMALAAGLVRRGARVVMTDINGERLDEAKAGAGAAERHVGDVRDGEWLRRLAADVARRHGRIDYLFNNAGVGIGGEVQYLTLEHWGRAIDVNIRGVINGIAAVYPIMIRQRSGTIVNTASMAGVGPLPFVVPYAMTKHAIVGLSRGLRMEAEHYGVRVCALCPVAVDTPMLDAVNPDDLPNFEGVWRPDLRRYFRRLVGPAMPAEKFVDQALRGVERNRGMIVVPRAGLIRWYGSRAFPSIAEMVVRRAMNAERRAAASGERQRASIADGTAVGLAPDPFDAAPIADDSTPGPWPAEPRDLVETGDRAG